MIFRRQLEQQRSILEKRLEDSPEMVARRPWAQRGVHRFNARMRSKLLFALASLQLKEVVDALDRYDEGDYGVCVSCGREIELTRLEVLPTVTHCWECQHKQGKSTGIKRT